MATSYSSYWHDSAPRFSRGETSLVSDHFDVAVIGGGFTGLSAARKLAKDGVRVSVLESEYVGFGGSGRNGGHLNNGIAHGYAEAKTHLGAERAYALYKAYDASIDRIEAIIAEEEIDCAFRRSGKLKLASKPSHISKLRANFELIHREVDSDTAFIEKADLGKEIGSDSFYGAMLYAKSGMMHMGSYVTGLANAAVRHGATIWENAPVTEREKTAKGWQLSTPRGTLTAEKVILATNAYTPSTFRYFRRRILSIGSFVIATRPLTASEIAEILPGNRTCVTSMNIGNYFRLTPDHRLIFGGRSRFSSVSDQTSDEKSGRLLQQALARTYPQLAEVEIDYCWGGLVGMTADRYPRAGEADGMIYGMGYSGHGAQMSTLLGEALSDIAQGRGQTNPLDGLDWPTIPLYSDKPWFLPLVGAWFAIKDRIS